MNLVRAELERLTARRFVQLMVLLLAVAFAVTTATTLLGSHRPTTSEMSAAQTQAARAVAAMEAEHTRCLQIRAGEIPIIKDGEYVPADCAELDPARMAQLPLATDYLSSVFVFSHEARGLLYFLIAFLVLFAFLVGASYIGADLNSGGVVNLLLWRPGRLTVLGTKLGTLVGVVAALSVLASALYLGTFWTIGQTAGLPGPLDGEFWGQLGAIYGRGLVLVLLAAVLGFGIATLGRHTSAALGAVAAYAVVWEVGCRLVLTDHRRGPAGPVDALHLPGCLVVRQGGTLGRQRLPAGWRRLRRRSLHDHLGSGAPGAAGADRGGRRGRVRRLPPPRPALAGP